MQRRQKDCWNGRMCVVRVVLLCKGRGSDASSYRPNRDESQWWNRRDALVRCVAAFLYGPASTTCKHHSRELVLIHDEDYARIEMRAQPNIVPTEQAILSLWREAAANPGQSMDVERDGVSCRMLLDSITITTDNSMPTNMDSKREVLEYLQRHCSIEFLRKHRLNSSVDVILRKTNKKALMDVWRQWNVENTSNFTDNASNKRERLSAIFQEVLKPMNTSIQKLVAAILHESSESELPCFNVEPDETPNLQICLFLGAVRVPIVRVRLGPVSEFTSKILSVVAHHDAYQRLGPALLQLCRNQDTKKAVDHIKQENRTAGTQKLHVLCFMPIRSEALSCDLSRRSRALWALVRVTVCTLWRSRLASSKEDRKIPLHNGLAIIFVDGVVVSLEQDELVTSLAEQHQAAPCEYQILHALCKKRDEVMSLQNGHWNAKWADELLESLVSKQSSVPPFAVDVCSNDDASDGEDLLATLYSAETNIGSMNGGQLFLLLRIRNDGDQVNQNKELADQVKEACERRGIPVLRESLVAHSIQDVEAATVTMIQHFIYHGRWFPTLERRNCREELSTSDKKRRRKKDKKARKGTQEGKRK